MKRTLGIILCCLVVKAFGQSGVVGLGGQEKHQGLKVLMIGNSFSVSLMNHLPHVAADCGFELDLASLYIGGCSFLRHWENMCKADDKDFRPYSFERNSYGRVSKAKNNVCAALALDQWDVVTIQQASRDSWQPKTYYPHGELIIAKIRELVPRAKIVMQETWSYTPWDKRYSKWGIDQAKMYDALHAAYGAFARQNGLELIPFGTAVQMWRQRLPVRYAENSFSGDVVGGKGVNATEQFVRTAEGKWIPNCDLAHLNEKGEYFQALVWAVALLDIDLSTLSYRPDFVTRDEARLMKEIAIQFTKGAR